MTDIVSDGNTKVVWCTTISNTAAPTTTELNNGVALDSLITADGLGLEFGNDSIDTTALSSTFSSSLPGRQTISGELQIKDQGRSTTPWSTFASKPSGYLVIRRGEAASGAWASSDAVEVYPMQAGQRRPNPPAANEVATFAVTLFAESDPVAGTVA